MASATSAGSMLYVSGSISTKIGVPPQYRMQFAVAINEWLAVITSGPDEISNAVSARCNAVVQLDTAHAKGAPINAANSRSNAATCGPCETQPDSTPSRAASASSFARTGIAIGITRRPPFVRGPARTNPVQPATILQVLEAPVPSRCRRGNQANVRLLRSTPSDGAPD